MRVNLFAFSVLLTLTSLGICRGDTWAAPFPHIFASEDGETALKVVPLRVEGQSYTSTATWIRLNHDGSEQTLNQLQLVNNPMRVLIPEKTVGFFVTLDNYANLGFEHTLVIYRSNGQMVHDLKLENFLTTKEILDNVEQTISSRWWRKGANFTFEIPSTETVEDKGDYKIKHIEAEPENARLHIIFPWGKRVIIKLATGEVLS